MPNVQSWLRHSHAAYSVLVNAYPQDLDANETAKVLALENVVAQLQHLRTHPSVAARVATGAISLHGWFFDLETGETLALDGASGRFSRIDEDGQYPVALPPLQRLAHTDRLQVAAK
jgi:carbonic anhydrase